MPFDIRSLLKSWPPAVAIPVFVAVLVAGPAYSQTPPPEQQLPATPLPPATKLEGFKPAAGSVTTLGYDELGRIAPG
ncbi:MAG TPA: hypothetical protein VNT81_17410, partial [Vicinamibacterales bacterium]|nr:hypothetical protein [Vicinamibacterales bacterium]